MKIFGIELFKFKKEPELLWDFAQFGILKGGSLGMGVINSTTAFVTTSGTSMLEQVEAKEEKVRLTPKAIYKLKALNDNKFAINADPLYVKSQILYLEEKLKFIGKPKKLKRGDLLEGAPYPQENMAVKYGKDELESMILRLRNRLKITEFKEVLKEYPHTTSKLINKVLKENNHLSYKNVLEFIPDLPREAISAMKKYEKMCLKLCNHKPVFYMIADHEDFERKNDRRDPILLAQSPFGHFWQILGAWDEEMVLLEEL